MLPNYALLFRSAHELRHEQVSLQHNKELMGNVSGKRRGNETDDDDDGDEVSGQMKGADAAEGVLETLVQHFTSYRAPACLNVYWLAPDAEWN